MFRKGYSPMAILPYCDEYTRPHQNSELRGIRQRPYCDEYTRSHQNSDVKHHKARSVLGWGTAWEALRVPLAFVCWYADS